jgi:hypothetical protein
MLVSRLTDRLVAGARLIEEFLDVEVALLPAQDGAEVDVRVAPREVGLVAALRGRKG